jgi:hypothetical protein
MAKEATMQGRKVLLIVLAVVAALAATYLGLSAGAPKAAGQPPPATTASSPAGSPRNQPPGPGPAHSPDASPQQTGQKMGSPAATPPKAPPPKAPPPKAPKPKACSSTAAAQPPASTIRSDPPPPSATGPVHFGQVSAASFDNGAQLAMSGDYQALTMGFSKFEIDMGKGSSECDVIRSMSMTLPVTGTAQAGKLGFYVQGYALTDKGTSAQLTLRGNGQVKVQRFAAGFDNSYTLALEFPVTPGATYTLSVRLEVHQNPDTGGEGYLNMSSIDSQIND